MNAVRCTTQVKTHKENTYTAEVQLMHLAAPTNHVCGFRHRQHTSASVGNVEQWNVAQRLCCTVLVNGDICTYAFRSV
jgi:hypothetical protein